MKRWLLLLVWPALLGASQTHPAPSDWSISAGAAIATAPKYPGSKGTKTIPVPFWDIRYKKRIFSRGLEFVGLRWIQQSGWEATTSLRYDFRQRKENTDERLVGLGDISDTLRVRTALSYSFSLYKVSLSAAQDVLGKNQGLLMSGDTAIVIPFIPRWFFTGGPGITWSDQKYSQTFFGVSPAQSAASGMAPFSARAGLSDVHFKMTVSRTLSPHWSLTTLYNVQRLLDSGRRSPITQTPVQHTGLVSILYKFTTAREIP